jgi:hypothetical protein
MRLTGAATRRLVPRGVATGVLGASMLVCASGFAHEARLIATGPLLPPGFHAGRPPPGLIAPPWGCAPGVRNCISQEELRILLERQRRFDNLRQDAPVTGVLPMPQQRPMPPPTPENEVQPAYRESGSIRPEFRDSGTPINPR